jgi:hypothetical protein
MEHAAWHLRNIELDELRVFVSWSMIRPKPFEISLQ